jgi:hypothetical protein
MKRSMIMLTAIAAALLLATPAYAAGGNGVVFNSVPNKLHGNVASLGFQATQASEFGDGITFAASSKTHLKSVKVVMSVWACQTIQMNGNCLTAPGATFTHPITFNIYATDNGVTPGALIASDTQTFGFNYRPSTNVAKCPSSTAWWSKKDHSCFNGFAQTITFDFASQHLLLPSQIVYGVAYNTSGYGANPKGYSNPCNSATEGCPYDSLNVGAEATLPATGTDRYPNGTFYNSAAPGGQYCDLGAGGSGFFRLDDGCWTVNNPMVRFQNQK